MNETELDLGIMPDKTKDSGPCCASPPDMEQPRYPEISFDGKHATMFMEKYGPLSTDDELTITFRTRVKKYSDGDSEWDKCVKLCALAVIGDVVESEASEKDEKPEKPAVRTMSKKSDKETAAAY